MVEHAGGAFELPNVAVGPVFKKLAGHFAVGVELQVVTNEQIEVAVVVIIEKSGAGAPLRIPYPGARGYISKRSLTSVYISFAGTITGDVNVWPAIIVVIPNGEAHS